MQPYDPSKIEQKWQKHWASKKTYESSEKTGIKEKKPKYYVLDMFPYPSGEGLHVGHPKGYIATDVVSRMKRMQGHEVLHPMGFDAFGLPAENYAIATKTNPADSVSKNVARYKKQLEILGFDYDWNREINTTDPAYYKWTQWIFLKLLEKELAYEAYEPINWCPKDKTGLANEDVENGRCERCGTLVEKKMMRQWILKITDYAERMLADLDAPAEIPHFKTTTGSDAWRDDMPVSERNSAFCIIKHWEKDEYLCMKWKKNNWQGYVIGGIEKGESAADTAVREIREETGYKNVVFKKKLGQTVAQFYQEIKKENRKANATVVYLELQNGEKDPVDAKIEGFQEVVWVPRDKVRDYVNRPDLKYMWDLYTGDIKQDLSKPLLDWPESIKELQRNWIGKSEGAEIEFSVKIAGKLSDKKIKVFTTRPDTLFGVTYVVIAPENSLVKELLEISDNSSGEVTSYIESATKKTEIERTDAKSAKTGVQITGVTAINPANNEEIPVWVADYVLNDYGTGAVMAVPAHDERDWDFAKKYNLPVKQVITPYYENKTDLIPKSELPISRRKTVHVIVKHSTENKYLLITWKKEGWNSLITGGVESGEDLVAAARREVLEETGYKNLRHIEAQGSDWQVHSYFYASHKNENRYMIAHGVFLQLENDERVEVGQDEQSKHELVWVDADKVRDFITHINQKLAWDYVQDFDNCLYTGEGKLINSGKFDFESSNEAKKKITESAGGKSVIKYKLRPWVFSRQRYWGEPIPVVHCLGCAAEKQNLNAIIIHGCPSDEESLIDMSERSYNKHWIPWTKRQLDLYGIKTAVPLMPTPWDADYNEWKKEFEKNQITENTILIGHSCGGSFLVRWLSETKNKVHSLVLVAPWKIPDSDDKKSCAFYGFDIDSDINTRVKNIFIFTSDNEFEDGKKSVEIYKKYLNARVTSLENRGHYIMESMKTEEFPELIDAIASVASEIVPVPEKDLPVELPKVESYEPTGTGESPLAAIEKWVNVKCPKCKGKAKRETNTMPQWAGSSWYYLRYMDPENKKALVTPEREKYWAPVDLYVGGAEHATRHLIYARFWHKFLYDIGVVSTIEPFKRLQSVGLIMAEDGRKMSKRYGNVVNPDEIVKNIGADSLRVYEMFMGPFDQAIGWSTNNAVGARRFIERVWRLQEKVTEAKIIATDGNNDRIDTLMHKTVKKVTEDIEAMRFNTAISSMMILVNEIEKEPTLAHEHYDILLKLLAPFAPHVTEELWLNSPVKDGHKVSIHLSEWPKFDLSKTVESKNRIAVQVGGKTRAMFDAEVTASDEVLKAVAMELPEIKKWVGDKPIKKVIVVKGRLVSIVI